jgi:hypothetical protein
MGTIVGNKIYYIRYSNTDPIQFDVDLPTVQKMINSFEIKKPLGEPKTEQLTINVSSCNNGYGKGVYDAQRDLQGLNRHGYDPFVHHGDLDFRNCYRKGYDAT